MARQQPIEEISATACPLFIVENFPPSVGGVESFNTSVLGEIATRTIGDRAKGGTLLLPPESRSWIFEEAPQLASAFDIPEVASGKQGLLEATLALIDTDPPPVIVIMRASKRLRPVLVAAHRTGIPVVTYVHGRTSTFDRWPRRFWWRKRTGLHLAARVATNSEYMARNLVSVGHLRREIEVIPLGIDGERFSPNADWRAQERENASIGESPLIVTVSRLVGAKGHRKVIDVFPALLEKFPDLKWWIVGDGPSRSEIESAIDRAGIADAVSMYGTLPDPRRALAAADLFVLLAEQEAFGLAALEAQAMGIPALVLEGSGLEEIVESGVSGEVIGSDQDAILKSLVAWLENGELRREAQKSAQTLARQYTWKRTTDQFLELITAVSSSTEKVGM